MKKTLFIALAVSIAGANYLEVRAAGLLDKFKQSAKDIVKKVSPTAQQKFEELTGVKAQIGKVYPTDTNISTQIRNKTTDKLEVEVGPEGVPGQKATIEAGSVEKPTTLDLPVDISKKTVIKIWTGAAGDRPADKTFIVNTPGKTIYVTYDGKIRPQTGKFLFTTTGGYALNKNVSDADIVAA